ncbi:MAG: SRP-less Sec system protein [Leptospira sp.]|nr:SRP-less Sec system protein [Leptospira sp.]
MKFFFVVTLSFLTLVNLSAQDSLDFLDKVNDKPKTVAKQKDETQVTLTKKQTVATKEPTTKKKKSKKKSQAKQSLTTNENTNPILPQNLVQESKNIQPEQKLAVEEDVNLGVWLDTPVNVEPAGLPGFASDLSKLKNEVSENISNSKTEEFKVGGGQPPEKTKSLFNFSEFFEKYKKAMLIFGIIILFAFYRLKSSRPSSSRSYRR